MALLIKLPLQRRIMLLVAGGLGLTLVAAALVGHSVIAQSTERVLQERLLLARTQAARVDERLSMAVTWLEGLASTFRDVWPGTQPGARVAASTVVPDLFSGGLIVVDAAGRGIWPDRYRGVVLRDPAIQQALGGRPAVTGLVRLPPDNVPAAVILVPLRKGAGVTRGALGGIIDLRRERLTPLIAPLAFGRTGHAVIVDRNGMILAGTEAHELFTRGEHPQFFLALMRTGRAHIGRTPRVENGEAREIHVMAFAPLALGNWGLGFGQSEEEVFEHEHRLQRQIVLLGAALLALGVWFGWRDAGVIAAPLRRLVGVAQRIAEGDLESPVRPEAGYEVGLLAAALETMRASLQRQRAELERRAEVISQREREARALYEVSRAIIREADLSAILSTVASSARSLLGADVSAVCLWDETGRLFPRALDGPGEAVAVGEGVPGCEELGSGADWRPGRYCPFVVPAFRRVHVTASLQAGDQQVGYMCVGYRLPRAFGAGEGQLLSALASLAAIAIRSAQLREQAQHLLVLQERERIGRDLHDSVIQSLYGISLALEHCQHQVQGAAPHVAARLDETIGALTRVIQEVRTYVMGLPPAAQAETLRAALERVIQEFRINTLLPVEFRYNGEEADVTAEQRLHLQLLLREALGNVARHAGAAGVVVEAGIRDGELSVVVSDDGRGFDLESAVRGAGLGLRTMEERARRLGGRLRIDTSPGRGTRVEVRVPAPGNRESAA